ncbi:aliphatic sulfonate ABC transporter substrate-binding protein (plasmid) [Azospirillum argentinense]|uniref:Putative aliphatic sulfonates-binding protein n=1 Tax=Azospirillum argentinense TaxID=2970906 RepID=A0A060DN63_9PROT|nr:aliphatic sulfonate ABC transporter substrate-binding protein [Azospirillum argentinense]AIB15341.1 aliphatic sulfonate ABC transporter substrate-binding protein [Azospirillum argentinense]EZQ04146.1 ABC transporter substrate-binding protein [Azospirillum argentinense]
MAVSRFVALAVAAAIGLGLAGTATTSAAADDLRIAAQPFPLYAPLFVAKQKKWLDEELAKVAPNAAVKWSLFPAGPPINESFAAGQQDVGFVGDTPALVGKAAGLDTSAIALTSDGPKSLAVVVGGDSPIASPKELKGRKVAVTKGSYAHHLLALVLEQGGLTLSDVELINLPVAEIPPAIVAGTIDAGAVWEPILTRFESQKAVRVLADGTGIKKGLLLIVADNGFLKNRPEQAKALLTAYKRASEFITANPKEAADLISGDVNLAPDLLVQVLQRMNYDPAIHDDDVAEVKKTEQFMRAHGLIKSAVDVDAFFNRKPADEAGLK